MVAPREKHAQNAARTPLRADAVMAVVGVLVTLGPALALHGFTVDDALIPARYAAHLASGLGYRFNAGGPVTDGVTPLGWAYLLAPFARQGPLAALAFARTLGLVAWVGAGALLAVAIGRVSTRPARFGALALVAASAPLAAWSGAGLETGVVTALASLAVTLRFFGRHRLGSVAAGLVAGLRPELLPWAAIVALIPSDPRPGSESTRPLASEDAPDLASGRRSPSELATESASERLFPSDLLERAPLCVADRPLQRGLRLLLALVPFAAAATLRGIVFGRLAPLSALAKPPDLALGARYAVACFLLTGPVALVAPRAFLRLSPFARGLVLSVAVHFGAIALAGGDWMPLSRLAVPVLPTVALTTAYVASVGGLAIAASRIGLAVAGELFVMTRIGPVAARVIVDRLAVLRELAPALAKAKVVATVDVGWTGAATEATLLDLAGVTDPTIALLGGGHTTKHISADLLDARGVDTLVLLLGDGAEVAEPWTRSVFARGVEARIAHFPGIGEAFAPVSVSSESRLHYLVLARVAPRIVAPAPATPSEPLDPGEPLGL